MEWKIFKNMRNFSIFSRNARFKFTVFPFKKKKKKKETISNTFQEKHFAMKMVDTVT